MSGSIGVRGGTVSGRIPLRLGLVDLQFRKNPEPLRRTDIPPAAGAGRVRRVQHVKHPDGVVLEVRRLSEQAKLSRSKIVAELKTKGIEIDEKDVTRYATYATRGALVPDENAAPYI